MAADARRTCSTLFDVAELKKYMTEEELAELPGDAGPTREEKH